MAKPTLSELFKTSPISIFLEHFAEVKFVGKQNEDPLVQTLTVYQSLMPLITGTRFLKKVKSVCSLEKQTEPEFPG